MVRPATRVLFDACVPRRLDRELPGFSVEHITELGLADLDDGPLLDAIAGRCNAAWLLNGIGGNQTFGMTSGTSGCDVTKTVRNETDRTEYAAINFDNLSADAARGAGEHLAGLAQVMTIAETDRAAFYTLMQSRYDNLFGQTATPESMLVSLDDAMRADAHLAQYVR